MGNVVLSNGQRTKGELFYDESVQKILEKGNVLSSFLPYVKYPRTNHIPWSENIHNDDRVINSMDMFTGQRVIVTEKMDGENPTMYSDYIHARSVDGRSHPSRNWVKNFWSQIKQDIPNGWRVCGENLFAEHSIHYDDLKSYFYGFSIWNERNICLNWDDTKEWFNLLGIEPVPVLFDGIYDEKQSNPYGKIKIGEIPKGMLFALLLNCHILILKQKSPNLFERDTSLLKNIGCLVGK